MNQLCKVCGEPAAGFHFGAFTCEGCKSFFGRTYSNVTGVSECKNGGRCEINKKNRTACKSCRLRKCLSVGMSKSGSRYGRRSNWFKIHCLLSAQNQNGNGSSPETNNNNSTVTNHNNHNGDKNYSNNNKNSEHSSLSKSLPAVLPSLSSHNNSGHSGSENDRTHPSSSASRLNGGHPPHLASLVGLSPESREQFLSSLNLSMVNPELCEYFRNSGKSKPFYPDEGTDDMSRSGRRSPGSVESPNSEASLDDNKSTTPMLSLPPGSPLDVKPIDFSPFDFTRDLLKMGYDPLRLWPSMLSTPTNLHSFNPYRFMFPNFPGAAAAFPGAFPPNIPQLGVSMPGTANGSLHSSKVLSAAAVAAAAAAENLALPLSFRNGNLNHDNKSPMSNHNITRRFNTILPPSSSLTITPPISHNGSSDAFTPTKCVIIPEQDSPIDLSASSNNNEIIHRFKREIESSDIEDNISDVEVNNSDEDMKIATKSYYEDSDEEGSILSRRNSTSSCSPKNERVSSPLDLTRTTHNNNNSSPPKIAT